MAETRIADRNSYKWKNHFSEMKGDVGMSPHEKEEEQEDVYTKTRNSFITPSLHLCLCNHTFSYITRYQLHVCSVLIHKQQIATQHQKATKM